MKTTNLRIPDEMLEALKKSAEANKRSMNMEIQYALDLYLGDESPMAFEYSLKRLASFAKKNIKQKGK